MRASAPRKRPNGPCAFFASLPCFQGAERGSRSGRGLGQARADTLGSPSAGLMLRGLAVVARRTRRMQTRPRVGIGDATCEQRAARVGEVVGHCRRLRAQHAPRMGVEVAAPDVRPPSPVRARPPVSPAVRSPDARERHNGHHGQSVQGTRIPSTGGRGRRGKEGTPFSEWARKLTRTSGCCVLPLCLNSPVPMTRRLPSRASSN